jgi:O-antigen/teichoic acid export membrane protein
MTTGLPERFASGTAWTTVGFAMFAAAGVLVNVIIAAVYGAAALGAFNLVLSVYTLSSQVSVLGVHNSVVRYVAIRDRLVDDLPTVLAAALLVTLGLGSVAGGALFLLSDAYAGATNSPGVAAGLRLVAPALVLFSLNKVLMAALNGERRMRAFALGQMLRSVLLVGVVGFGAARAWPAETLPAAFLWAEAVLFFALFLPRVRGLAGAELHRLGSWVRTHLSFGSRGFLGGLMVEANTRIDVLMLGFLVDDTTVGLYSFASMFAVGLHNLMLVVKQNVNPVLSEQWAAAAIEDIHALIRTVRRVVYPATAALSLVILAAFPLLARLLGEEASRDSTIMLAILLAGIALAAGYLPFDAFLVQAGHPGAHTMLIALGAASNALLNLLLIPLFEGFGAAFATTTAVCLSAGYLEVAVRLRLRFPLTRRRRRST